MKDADLRSKFLGGLLGSAIGDAIGQLAFSYPRKDLLAFAIDRAKELRYTDDTAMAIGLAEALIRAEGIIDEERLGESFRMHYEREPWRGYASGPPTLFSMVKSLKITYREAARRLFGGKGSFGNGAAMRITPVGLFFFDKESLYDQVRASSEVTHSHPLGIDGAAVQARAIALSVMLDPLEAIPLKAFIASLLDFSRTKEMRDKIELIETLLENCVPPHVAARELGQSVAAHESVPFAIYSFLRNYDSFEKCLHCAVLSGGDRDTLGAMACAISGAYLGIEHIPRQWMEKLENRDYIEALASRLFMMKNKA
ncbi:MAG: ADP-ribosylglycohydrolase family protein [Deltaproteobacteria bacterium]|nr:ADP-ribosylglycohydrolase family protein [Deltaproteobacteria bacterium]